MEVIDSKQLDHHGLIAVVIKEIGLSVLIDGFLPLTKLTRVSHGQAISAMLLNSMGFTSRPLSLTPQFFSSKALDVLFTGDIKAEDLNRHRLGRCLDAIYDYGCDKLFSEISHKICNQEGIDRSVVSLDTSSFKVTWAYDRDTDEHEITISRDYSKDHRPDLKQVVLELLVSQDGGYSTNE